MLQSPAWCGRRCCCWHRALAPSWRLGSDAIPLVTSTCWSATEFLTELRRELASPGIRMFEDGSYRIYFRWRRQAFEKEQLTQKILLVKTVASQAENQGKFENCCRPQCPCRESPIQLFPTNQNRHDSRLICRCRSECWHPLSHES